MNEGDDARLDREDGELDARRLDWALHEVVGGECAPDVTGRVLARAAAGEVVADDGAAEVAGRGRWLAFAAVFLLGALTVVGVALSSRGGAAPGPLDEVQQPGDARLPRVTSPAAIAALAPDLRAVELRNLDDAAVAALVARCPDLEHLSVHASTAGKEHGEGAAESITDAALAAIAKLRRLRRLDLDGVVLVQGPGLAGLVQLPLLATLSLRFFDVPDEHLQVLPRLPSLRELRVDHNQVLGAAGLEAIGRCPGLRSLSLRAAPGQERSAFAHLHALRHLEVLDLGGINRITRGFADEETRRRFDLKPGPGPIRDGGVVAESLGDWPRLHTLSLADSPELGAEIGQLLRQRYPRLREVDLSGCPGVDDTTVAHLVALPSLRCLRLGYCPNIGEPSIALLAAAGPLREVDFGTAAWLHPAPWLTLAHVETLLRARKRVRWQPPEDRREGFDALLRKYEAVLAKPGSDQVRTFDEIESLADDVDDVEVRGLGDRAAELLAQRLQLRRVAFVRDDADLGGAANLPFTKKGLRALAALPRLEELELNNLPNLEPDALAELRPASRLRALDVVGVRIDDAALEVLPALPALRAVALRGHRTLGAAGLQALARCRGLQRLDLANCGVLDAGALSQLGGLRQLTELDLSGNPGLLDRALMSLRHCTALRTLRLADGQFSSMALQALADMQGLEVLDVSGNAGLVSSALLHVPVSVRDLAIDRCSGFDAAAAPLLRDRFPKLWTLRVGQNDWVTDDVLRTLLQSPSLGRLHLLRCAQLTNASFATIRAARSLRFVDTNGTACVSKEQHEQLRRERPDLEVVRFVW